MPLAQLLGGDGQAFQFGVRFLQGNLVVLAGREATVGIQCQSRRRHMLQGLFNAGHDLLGCVDFWKTDIDATQTNRDLLRQFVQYCHVPGDGEC
jgi:hypothetical protein